MHNHEASSSSDEEGDGDMATDQIAAMLLEAEGLTTGLQIDPEVQREQEIMAEVARRRAERDPQLTAAKRKSDEIFRHFDADGDGYLNYSELKKLGIATGGELPKLAYDSICQEIGANPACGVTKELLLLMYTDAGLGDAHRDYNLIFGAEGS